MTISIDMLHIKTQRGPETTEVTQKYDYITVFILWSLPHSSRVQHNSDIRPSMSNNQKKHYTVFPIFVNTYLQIHLQVGSADYTKNVGTQFDVTIEGITRKSQGTEEEKRVFDSTIDVRSRNLILEAKGRKNRYDTVKKSLAQEVRQKSDISERRRKCSG